jgi:hypothetical protein
MTRPRKIHKQTCNMSTFSRLREFPHPCKIARKPHPTISFQPEPGSAAGAAALIMYSTVSSVTVLSCLVLYSYCRHMYAKHIFCNDTWLVMLLTSVRPRRSLASERHLFQRQSWFHWSLPDDKELIAFWFCHNLLGATWQTASNSLRVQNVIKCHQVSSQQVARRIDRQAPPELISETARWYKRPTEFPCLDRVAVLALGGNPWMRVRFRNYLRVP